MLILNNLDNLKMTLLLLLSVVTVRGQHNSNIHIQQHALLHECVKSMPIYPSPYSVLPQYDPTLALSPNIDTIRTEYQRGMTECDKHYGEYRHNISKVPILSGGASLGNNCNGMNNSLHSNNQVLFIIIRYGASFPLNWHAVVAIWTVPLLLQHSLLGRNT